MNIIQDSLSIIRTEGFIRFCVRVGKRGQRNLYYLVMWAVMYRQSRFRLKDMNDGLKPCLGSPAGPGEQSVSRIIKAYNRASVDQQSQPGAYKISGDWAIIFNSDQQELVTSLKEEDIPRATTILSSFSRNRASRGLHLSDTIPQSFFHKLMLLDCYNKSYLVWKKMTVLPEEVLHYRKDVGNMHGMDVCGKSIMLPSFNQSYFGQKIELLLRGSTKKAVVLEIGGGYGSLPYHLFRHTSLNVTYVFVDLPEMCTLASYFLMSHFPDKKILLYKEGPVNFTNYDIIILPNFSLPSLPSQSIDLVFNSHSMCQMEPSTLKEYLTQIDRICTGFFLHANNEDEVESLTPDKRYINMNTPEFELPKEHFRRLHRFPELIRNDGFLCFEWCSWEYLYERIR
jgi:hypothetical protein